MPFENLALLCSAIILVFNFRKIEAQSCGGTYSSSSGVFTSPNYPNVYDTNRQCTYTISLSAVSSITLSFETFELDRSSGDYVTISCASNSSFPLHRYYWNDKIRSISIPWCRSGRLIFYSDSYRYYSTRGFRVQYQASTNGCGNTVFNTSSGTISSPNYPQNYNKNENCTYSIWASQSSSFALSFKAFYLDENCHRVWVQIRCDDSGYIFPEYCGSTIPKPIYINNCNEVLIWFHTDNSRVFSGFSLQYSVTPDGCGKSNYAGLSGIVNSPSFPRGYTNMSCYYYLYPVGSVALVFQSFDLEPFIDSVNGDYVQINCASNSSYGSFLYRGNTLPPLITFTLCSRVRLFFYTNNALSGAGFSVKYQVNPLVAHSAIIVAPKNFTVYIGSRVQLDCTSSETGYYPSWTLNRDGTDENAIVIASFCVVNSGYEFEYQATHDGQGVCKLAIKSASLDQAGVYTCTDVSLASASSVVAVEDFQHNSSPNGIAIFLIVLFILAYIGVAVFFVVRRWREISREEGQQTENQDMNLEEDAMGTRATISAYEDLPVFTLSPESSMTLTKMDESNYEPLRHGFDNLDLYDNP